MYRITVSLPKELQQQIEQLKKEQFYNLPYSELYRQAIILGIKAMETKSKK